MMDDGVTQKINELLNKAKNSVDWISIEMAISADPLGYDWVKTLFNHALVAGLITGLKTAQEKK